VDRKTRALALIVPALVALGLARVPGRGMAAAQSAPAAARWPLLTLTPPDLEARDAELARVRDRLLAAIAARDLAAVRALMAPTLRDQDADVPVDDVLATMGPLASMSDPLVPLSEEWRALEQALRLGGVRIGSRYVVPFMARAVGTRRSAATEVFVAGRDVGVRDEASSAAPIVARVSNAVLEGALVNDAATPDDVSGCRSWTGVVMPAAEVGWVCAADTRPMVGLYYDFERIDGAWRLVRLWALEPVALEPAPKP